MNRTAEGWFVVLASAPILLWVIPGGVQYISSWLFFPSSPKHFWVPSSLADAVLLSLFAMPSATGAYHYVTQSDEGKRRKFLKLMLAPTLVLYLIQVADAHWEAFGWLDVHELLVKLLGLIVYLVLTLQSARLVVVWQERWG